jgi:NADH:ubiquinone oxidoreductase subunit K
MLIDLSYLGIIVMLAVINTMVFNTETIGLSVFLLGLAATETTMGLLIIRSYFLAQQTTDIDVVNKLHI